MRIITDDNSIGHGIREAEKIVNFPLDYTVTAIKVTDGAGVAKSESNITVRYSEKSQFFYLLATAICGGFSAETGNCDYRKLGIMLDCARNAVPKVSAIKEFIVRAALSGYNYIALYLEDCLCVDGQPHFGYMRGRYSKDEIKEIVSFADLFGIEIVPFVQTLAHMGGIFRHWTQYYSIMRDTGDILLMDEPAVYGLIDNVFATVKECFGNCRINIGMDEAFLMTCGKYREKHGIANVGEVFSRHVKKVSELAVGYGLKPEAWADMFVKYKIEVPSGLSLRAWNYYAQNESEYFSIFDECVKIAKKCSFASAVHKWYGYVPLNEYSESVYLPALKALKGKTDDFLVTLWGDDGGECSFNAVWYSLLKISFLSRNGGEDLQSLSEFVKKILGYSEEELLSVDMPNKVFDGKFLKPVNPSKYILFKDIFIGNTDFSDGVYFKPYFKKTKEKFALLCEKGGFLKELFKEYHTLCAVLEIKCGLRTEIIKAYKSRDSLKLKTLAEEEIGEAFKAVDCFISALRQRWTKENKSFGFEVQLIRLGGLKERLNYCKNTILEYVCGKTDVIEELEEADLSPAASGDNYFDAKCFNDYEQNVTYCNLTHKIYT